MDTRIMTYATESQVRTTAKILAFTPRPRPEARKPTLLDVLERQLFDDGDP